MTSHSNSPFQSSFDPGPLSWVISEIRDALQRSRSLLEDALQQDPETQATTLRQARANLHQAHGALQIVDIDGVPVLTEAIEKMLDMTLAGKLAFDRTIVDAADGAGIAVVEYLDELLSGGPQQSIRLFPYYKAVLQACGNEKAHPSDLFYPNLAIRPQLPIEASAGAAIDFSLVRQRFERALLPFLRSVDTNGERNAACDMAALVADVERSQVTAEAKRFWWVLRGFAEGVASGDIHTDLPVKQLFGRINLQLRRLADGSSQAVDRLVRDALFFIAAAPHPGGRTAQVRSAYQLEGLVPADYERRRYGLVAASLLATARDRLNKAKTLWSRLASGDETVGTLFESEMQALAEAGGQLQAPSLEKLLRELNGIARAAHSHPADALALEMAGSLLFVESALNHASRLSEGFSHQADALTARLLAIIAGEQPATRTDWLDEMSRDAQQKETVIVLAGEMRTSLNQVEKGLEEFFSDCSRRAALPVVDGTLHQVEGALAILDQEAARAAVVDARESVRRFAALPADQGPDAEESQRVARNLGALSFFLESLQKQPEGAAGRFRFDAGTRTFEGRPLDPDRHAQLDVVVDPLPDAAADMESIELAAMPDLPTVTPAAKEADPSSVPGMPPAPVESTADTAADMAADMAVDAELLDIFLGEAEEVIACVNATLPLLQAQPSSLDHLTTLRRSFHTLKGSGRMVGLTAFGEAAWSIEQVLNVRLADGEASTPPLNALIEMAATLLGEWIADLRLSGRSDRTPDALVAAALRVRSGEDFRNDGDGAGSAQGPELEVATVIANDPGRPLASTGTDVASDPKAREALLPDQSDAAEYPDIASSDHLDDAAGVPETDDDALKRQEQPLVPALADEPLAFAAGEERAAEDAHEDTGVLAVSVDDLTGSDVAADHGANLFPTVASDAPTQTNGEADFSLSFDTSEDASAESAADDTSAATHDLASGAVSADISADSSLQNRSSEPSSPRSVEGGSNPDAPDPAADAQANPAQAEQPAEALADATPEARARVIDLAAARLMERRVDDNIKCIGTLEISLPLYNIYIAETDDLVRLLAHDFSEWRHEPERPVHTTSVHAAHSLAGSSATVGFTAVHELAHATEMILQSLARRPVQLLASDFLLLQQAVDRIKSMLATFAQGDLPEPEPSLVEGLQGRLADLAMRPAINEHNQWPTDQPSEESGSARDALQQASEPEFLETLQPLDTLEPLVSSDPAKAPQDGTSHLPAVTTVEAESKNEHSDGLAVEQLQNDELDADLLPIFLEEGRDMLPQIGRELRAWQAAPAEPAHLPALLRLLHTIKGSARMAGAMAFGQHMHDVESRIEHICSLGNPTRDVIEDLLNRFDLALFIFDRLQNPQPAANPVPSGPSQPAAGPLVTADPSPTAGGNALAKVATQAGDLANPMTPVPLVRVRADLLDRLVNQAGEVSIARSRAETEVGGLRQSLLDLTDNVSRLRSQLREIEIQAESQMASQMASSTEREFDPLEFDRFTRLQELTRMMAESVSDVASLQGTLSRSLDNTDAALVTQARLTRDLQQDLMRVRMVQFASIAERLYRVTRQVAKEVDKRVNLDVRGATVEIDRGVLEKMAGPFEHLLRNAIVHGIESRAERLAAGKSEMGEIQVAVRQEGNEVVIELTDDGRGLDLARIRSKAQSSGLLDNDADPAESELYDLIFHPGFSTASEVTPLAGRGVGMDVVRSEAAALGGRIELKSEAGRGARFLIRLPLTLAVTQVVLVSTGGKIYALPSVLVEQVQQLKSGSLAAAYNDGAVVWQGQRVPLHFLASLLGDSASAPVAQQYSPVILLRSGADRVAIHVDDVIGNREVVVKNIGPQLSRLAGIAGATVLGSGDIVLILNPVPLAQRAASAMLRAPRMQASDAPLEMGAVAELGQSNGDGPVQGLRTQQIVMVVDDSLTVRRVTQRLLAREGYQVVLAKDGVDALQQLQEVTPDVMLLDIEMPRMDGFDLTRNLRSDERTRQLPIIMITSRTAAKHRNYAMELGVNAYLGKPYQEAELLGLIQGFVRREVTTA